MNLLPETQIKLNKWINVKNLLPVSLDNQPISKLPVSVLVLIEWKFDDRYEVLLNSALFDHEDMSFETDGIMGHVRAGVYIPIKDKYRRGDPIAICFIRLSDLEDDAKKVSIMYEFTTRDTDKAE